MGKVKLSTSMKAAVCCLIFFLPFRETLAQNLWPFHFGNPIILDSASTLLFPVNYYQADKLPSSIKVDIWDNHYSGLVFYDVKKDSILRLFKEEVYIAHLNRSTYNKMNGTIRQDGSFSRDWILYRVKNMDTNKNGQLDKRDADILFVSDYHGKNLKKITSETESVVSIDIFNQQNYALIKLQLDTNKDGSYDSEDQEFCYRRLDLKTLTLGQKITVR
jgi:hypothetical protein